MSDMKAQVEQTLSTMKKNFNTGVTKPISFRKQQLRQLAKGIRECKGLMEEACLSDLGRAKFFTELSEIGPCLEYCDYFLEHVDEFSKDQHFDTPLLLQPCTAKIKYEPFGVSLIYGAWNYPYYVTLKPLAQAIATGNSALIKPSELSPKAAEAIKKVVEYLDTRCYQTILGGVDCAIELNNKPFDLICFTGSTQTGKIVAKAAAANLVPCILELGGKSPLIIDESADVDFAAMKCVFGKFQNGGQICIGVDYVLCHESKLQKFRERLFHHIKLAVGVSQSDKNPTWNPEVGKIVNKMHAERLQGYLDEIKNSPKTQILMGGKVDIDDLYLSPTVVMNPPLDSQMMTDEIFGTILPILTFQKFDEVIEDHVRIRDKPLAIYYFGNCNHKNFKRLEEETSSGSLTANDILAQVLSIDLGFGGVGGSGQGRFGGLEGYRRWTNPKAVMTKWQLNIPPITWLSPPYTNQRVKLLRMIIGSLWLQKNKTIKPIAVLFGLFIAFQVCFGQLGQSQFRKEIFGAIVNFLKQYT